MIAYEWHDCSVSSITSTSIVIIIDEVSFTLLFKANLYLDAFQMLKPEYSGIPG